MKTMRTKTFVVSWLTTALIAASLVAAARPQAPSRLPDTPAAHQFSGWLKAFNSGNRATLAQFLGRKSPLPRVFGCPTLGL